MMSTKGTMRIYKICPVCGKRMVKQYANMVLASYPPQYPWNWWCGCGHVETGGIEREKTMADVLLDEWQRANDIDGSEQAPAAANDGAGS